MPRTITVGLSWITYVRPAMEIAGWAGVAAIIGAATSGPPEPDSAKDAFFPMLIFLGGAARGAYQILLNRSTVLTIGQKGVRYVGGVLPWKRWENYWSYRQIYGTSYAATAGFWDWLLRFGDLIIVGGNGERYQIAGLHDPRQLQIEIAQRVERYWGSGG